MANRNLPHIILHGVAKSKVYNGRGGGNRRKPSQVEDRVAHAQRLIDMINEIKIEKTASATYLEIVGRSGETFFHEKFNVSGLSLLNIEKADPDNQVVGRAVIKASKTDNGLIKLNKKLNEFITEDTKPDRYGKTRPKHADLVNSINTITPAGIQKLWRHPVKPFPDTIDSIPWEVWIEPQEINMFEERARKEGLTIYSDKLKFPQDTVILVKGKIKQLTRTVIGTGVVRSISPVGVPIDFVEKMEAEEQAEWVQDILHRTKYKSTDQQPISYVTILDTGIEISHPLIQPVLKPTDRHAAISSWSLDDKNGHGTKMAGLTIFGDLRSHLQSSTAISVSHHLESSKIIPDAGQNLHHLLGDRTRKAIDAVEIEPDRVRTFALATTTDEDTPHSGAPTSWSTELDQLTAGCSGKEKQRRLMVVSAGNILAQHGGVEDYLAKCDDINKAEIESPAQAWNVITVGAMTENDGIGGFTYGKTLAKVGDLAPMSRTASWKKNWPIKPDIVLEGGNWYKDGMATPNQHADLMMITTSRNATRRFFTHMSDSSAATALAARDLGILRAEYPDLWPETIRALYVTSARWTDQMLSHLPLANQNRRSNYDIIFKRYGYGQPNLNRALKSAKNKITLIAQDEIRPFKEKKLNEMRIFDLPWPVKVLRSLGTEKVNLRVGLSTFVEPNPSEVARGRKDRYASHGLRFELKGPDEEIDSFTTRIGGIRRPDDNQQNKYRSNSAEWDIGSDRRNVGSLHIDTMKIAANDLAQRGVLAIYPFSGWWKEENKKIINDPAQFIARFSLVVEIDAGNNEVDLYTEIQQKITKPVIIKT